MRWQIATGKSSLATNAPLPATLGPNNVTVGSGFYALQGTITAVKRKDPLVFFGNAFYTANSSANKGGAGIALGDNFGVKAGTLLVSGADSSLRFDVQLTRQQKTRVNGACVPGRPGIWVAGNGFNDQYFRQNCC